MYVNKTENVAVELVRAGLAQVHAYTAESLPFARQLFAAEEEAKRVSWIVEKRAQKCVELTSFRLSCCVMFLHSEQTQRKSMAVLPIICHLLI